MTMRASCSIVISLTIAICQLPAQNTGEDAWRPPIESRLKAIYEQGEFRPKGFAAEWLPDSSGFAMVEVDPQTNRSSRRVYDVRTGELAEQTLHIF